MLSLQAIFFLGIWTLSHIIAYIAYLTVELPFANLERLFKLRKNEREVPIESRHATAQSRPTVRIDEQKSGFDSGIITKYKF